MIVFEPACLADAVAVKETHPDAVLLAGGTDLVPAWTAAGGERPREMITLTSCKDMGHIEKKDGALVLGAMVSHTALAQSRAVIDDFPALAEAAATVGAPAIRNMGTLGGNLLTASPAADLPPVLLVYDASVVAVSAKRGPRIIPLASFFKSYRETALDPNEVLAEVRVPIPEKGAHCFFRKVGARKAQATAKISLALFATLSEGKLETVRIAAGSVAPVPMRLTKAEKHLCGEQVSKALALSAGKVAAQEVNPIDDVRSKADYRRYVTGAVLAHFLERLLSE